MNRVFASVAVAVSLLLAIDTGTGPIRAAAQATVTMRESVYDKLSRAQEAAETENWDQAFGLLEEVRVMRNLEAYEKAQLNTAYGYVHFARGDYEKSIAAYEKVLREQGLPEALEASTLYTLSQLSFHLESYEKAIGYLDRWLVTTTSPGPQPFVLRGQAYYQLERYDKALESMTRALTAAAERGEPVQESWYVLLRTLYYELENYPKLIDTLETLVAKFPRKEYWIHLAAAYGEIGDADRQVAAYEVAYEQGYLASGAELLTLSQLLLQANVPYRAGAILSRGLEKGVVEATAENWRLLSQMWIVARESAKAIESLTKAAQLSNDGELDARLAQVFANDGQWEKTVEAARVALRKGVTAPHEVHVMAGIALFELGRYEDAKVEFRAARESPDARTTASQWLAYVEREEKRLGQLAAESRRSARPEQLRPSPTKPR